jgi:DNA-binding HxlR family transcriptional regulator
MTLKTKKKIYQCPFEFALDMVSGKWKSLVLYYLSEETLRYGEIRKKIDGITQKMLTQTLRELEKNGLVSRKVYPVVPPKVEYTITQSGASLIPIFESLQAWGERVAQEQGVAIACDTKEPS